MKEGYLQKKGQLLKGWKKRWFVCDGRSLSYYITSKDKKPNAIIPLESATVQDGGISETWNSPRIYLTDGTSGTMYCLSAEEGGIVTEWLAVLRKSVARISERKEQLQYGKIERSRSSIGITPYDEEEGRKRHVPLERSPKKGSFIVHDPTEVRAKAGKGLKKVTQLSTNVRLENELSIASELLSSLLFNKPSPRNPIKFNFSGVENGVRISSAVNTATGKQYIRGSTVINVPPSIALRILLDHNKRNEWDIHFPVSSHVASYGASTDLIHLSGGDVTGLFDDPVLFHPTPALPALACAFASGVSGFFSQDSSMLYHSACGAILGGIISSMDWRVFAAPRDLLLLRHVYEATAPQAVEHSQSVRHIMSSAQILDSLGMSSSSNPTAIVIVEMSVSNELLPKRKGTVRAHSNVSGWLVEPLHGEEATLITYVTDLNVGGWVPSHTKMCVMLNRMKCLSAIAEYVHQAKSKGPHLGYLDDNDDDDVADDDEGVSKIQKSLSDSTLESPSRSSSAAVFHPLEYLKSMVQIPTGGMKLTDKEIAKKQNGVLMEVIKTMGTKLLEGKSAVSLSLPVRIFEPRSMLDRLVDLYLWAPNYLSKANDTTDMLERFKLTMTFAIAGWHHGIGCMKPFNPILGETLQAEFCDGASVYGEYVSHHPPINCIQVVGPKYNINSYSILNGSFQTNSVIQVQQGPVRVQFQDGTTIEFSLPGLRLGGFLWGDRVCEVIGNILFEDKANNLSCEIRISPDEKKGLFANKLPTDQFRGTVVQNGSEICDVSGSWLEDLRFGGEVYWSLAQDSCQPVVRLPLSRVLPSDSRNRKDLKALAESDLEEAQEWKLKLEKSQRIDRSVRKDRRRPNHWTFAVAN
jgi:hypothetical protein